MMFLDVTVKPRGCADDSKPGISFYTASLSY